MSEVAGAVDTFYFIFVGSLVFFMQAGFGMLEAGSVRTKNTRNILLKNLLDACIGAIIWWAWGFATAVRASRHPPPPHPTSPPLVHPVREFKSVSPPHTPSPIDAVRDGLRRQLLHRLDQGRQGLLRRGLGGQ